MSSPVWGKILDAVERREWPPGNSTSEDSMAHFEAGLDSVNSYRGQSEVFLDALKQFQSCESNAHAKAGIAAVLMTASYQNGNAYDLDGLAAAESYLTEAQRALPGRPEIEHLHAKLCLLRQQDDDARRILDGLHQNSPASFFTSSIEVWYWYNRRDIEMARTSFEVAKPLARTAAQRELIANQMAGCYQSFGDPADAISAYREIADVAPEDPWAWHNLSIQLLDTGKIREAEKCNTKALQLMEFQAAREVQDAIRQQKGGFWNWLRGLFRSNE